MYTGVVAVGSRLFVFGGFGESARLSDLYYLDLTTLSWTDLSPLPGGPAVGRYVCGFAAAAERLFVFGGLDDSTKNLKDMHTLDLPSLTWTDLAGAPSGAPPSPRYNHGCLSAGGRLFVFGGVAAAGRLMNDLHSFDPTRLAWADMSLNSSGAPGPAPRGLLGFAADGDFLYVFGGQGETGFLQDTHRFNLASRTWTELSLHLLGDAPSARHGHGFAAAVGSLFVFGGYGESGFLNDLHALDLRTLSWADLTARATGSGPSPRGLFGFASFDSALVVFGGYGGEGSYYGIFSLDAESLEWRLLLENTDASSSPTSRAAHAAAIANGRLIAFGGYSAYRSSASFVTDLPEFDLSRQKWRDLSSDIDGEAPSSRYGLGLASIDGTLYIFGGMNEDGSVLNDLTTLAAPADISWSGNAGAAFFIDVYDWDGLSIGPSASVALSWPITLGVGVFPCLMSISGAGGRIQISGNGSISCLASAGCTGLLIDSTEVTCDGFQSYNAVLMVQGAELGVYNSTFASCVSHLDGGAIHTYGGASVTVVSTTFHDGLSFGLGGAISIVGGRLLAIDTTFKNCSSHKGGGAVSIATAFCACDGRSAQIADTVANVQSCLFEDCRSDEAGGAILSSGQAVHVRVIDSSISGCKSKTTGGGISVNDGAQLDVVHSLLRNNSAEGLGGGALHSENADITLERLISTGNKALAGGGGVLYWNGRSSPKFKTWCGAGFIAPFGYDCNSSHCISSCSPCEAGKYQTGESMTVCISCEAGKFSSRSGESSSDTCISCQAGTYSTSVGARESSECHLCQAGTFSDAGSIGCDACEAGKYSNVSGQSSCVGCIPGTYSTGTGLSNSAICLECGPGSYSYAGADQCSNCVAGKYSAARGAISISTCVVCPPGAFSSVSGASICSMCEAGKFTGRKKYFTFELIQLGRHVSWFEAESLCMAQGGHLASIESDHEKQELLSLLPSWDFWIGLRYNVSTGNWTWVDGSDVNYMNWAYANPKSKSELYSCADFPSYGFATSTSGMVVTWPYFREEYGFDFQEYELDSGSWYNYNCENQNGWVNGYVCSIRGVTSCLNCSVGTYSTSVGATSSNSCKLCPGGEFANLTGSSTCATCNTALPSNENCLERTTGHERQHELPSSAMSSKKSVNTAKADILVSQHMNEAPPTRYETRPSKLEEVISRPKPASHRKVLRIDNELQYMRYKLLTKAAMENTKSSAKKLMRIMFESNNNEEQICGVENSAAYGDCFASSYARLKVFGLPTSGRPAYSGLLLTLSVEKIDVYGQIISSDSSSVLQIQAVNSAGIKLGLDSTLTISGAQVVRLQEGRASVSAIMKPAFSLVSPDKGVAILQSQSYITLEGVDLQTNPVIAMKSDVLAVILANGTAVCPSGYILILDRSATSSFSAGLGVCSRCGAGTYSVSALAGYTSLEPSCLNCPAGAISCSGGDQVGFSLGTWIITGGRYMLTGCPAGHQLVNSIYAIFSHDIQKCLPCLPDEYILDSNMSNFTCQPCPVGAICNGASLHGLVEGSIWQPDYASGHYILKSCPPGYQLLVSTPETQNCGLCQAGYFCTGGTASSLECPSGTFASPGATNISACVASIFVSVSVSLPMTRVQFTSVEQDRFQRALATSAGVSTGKVYVEKVTQNRILAFSRPSRSVTTKDISAIKDWCLNTLLEDNAPFPVKQFLTEVLESAVLDSHTLRSRRSSASDDTTSLQLLTKIATENAEAASAVSERLTATSLNTQLAKVGLPPASLNSVTVLTTPNSASNGGGGPSLQLVLAVSLGGFACLLILVIIMYYASVNLRTHIARSAFLAAFHNAHTGDKGTQNHLPLVLRKAYVAEEILGRGAFGCVVRARTKSGGRPVAIKIVLPEKGFFKDKEMRQLHREAETLEFFTVHKCEHAVQLVGSEELFVGSDLCYFVMELIDGQNLESILKDPNQGPISDQECIMAGRDILAALKLMHAHGLVHRDIKPANIMRRSQESPQVEWDGKSCIYKVLDFGTVIGIDERVVKQDMMTLASSRQLGVGTLPYMSPEMFKDPESAQYPTDLWSLGVTLFEIVTGCLPFEAESDLLMGLAIAGNMNERAPSVLDKLSEDRRAGFDNTLAKAIATALEKNVKDRFQSADEMHEALYLCLVSKNEACYSVFISYRVASEEPFARLLFDELNHSVTPGGHRVIVYWDAYRLVKGEEWEENFSKGLLNSLCFFPLLSYGSTAPLADIPERELTDKIAEGWEERPCGRPRLKGIESDPEDNVLKEILIAQTLLERQSPVDVEQSEEPHEQGGLLRIIYPILIGRQHPMGHSAYPQMGSFFDVQGGGGKYSSQPSPATNRAVSRFLRKHTLFSDEVLEEVTLRGVETCMHGLMALQGCRMWDHPADLPPVDLNKEQRVLVGKGYAGPPVALGGVGLSPEQEELCRRGLDEQQLRLLKAEIRAKRGYFHEIIDRAVHLHYEAEASLSVHHGEGHPGHRFVAHRRSIGGEGSIKRRRSSAASATAISAVNSAGLTGNVQGDLVFSTSPLI